MNNTRTLNPCTNHFAIAEKLATELHTARAGIYLAVLAPQSGNRSALETAGELQEAIRDYQ